MTMNIRLAAFGLIIVAIATFGNFESRAQFSPNSFGLSAAIAMPSGVTASAAIPTAFNANGVITFTNSFATSILFVASDNIQLDAGIGYVSVSTDNPDPTPDPDPLTTISFSAGGRYFINIGNVMPYLGVGFSFTNFPTLKVGGGEIKGSLMTVLGFFGAQAFINDSKTLALFIQIGAGFNSVTSKTEANSMTSETKNSSINFGGSAIGGSIYF